MTRKPKSTPKRTQPSQKPKEEEIPENEQWRIIRESGLLQAIEKKETTAGVPQHEYDTADRIFDTTIFVIPLAFLYLLMDILVHQQYGQQPTARDYASRLMPAIPVLYLIINYVNQRKSQRIVQTALFTASIALGTRLVWTVNKAAWHITIRQGPPMATLWVYTIVVLDLFPAVVSLAIVGVWLWWAGMKLVF